MIRNKTRIYSDLDLTFTPHPLTGDVPRKYDEDAVSRALKMLIMTDAGDRAFNREIDIGIREYLFEPAGIVTTEEIRSVIEFGIEKYEPRADVQEIIVELNEVSEDEYKVTIVYTTKNLLEPVTVTIYLQRVR